MGPYGRGLGGGSSGGRGYRGRGGGSYRGRGGGTAPPSLTQTNPQLERRPLLPNHIFVDPTRGPGYLVTSWKLHRYEEPTDPPQPSVYLEKRPRLEFSEPERWVVANPSPDLFARYTDIRDLYRYPAFCHPDYYELGFLPTRDLNAVFRPFEELQPRPRSRHSETSWSFSGNVYQSVVDIVEQLLGPASSIQRCLELGNLNAPPWFYKNFMDIVGDLQRPQKKEDAMAAAVRAFEFVTRTIGWLNLVWLTHRENSVAQERFHDAAVFHFDHNKPPHSFERQAYNWYAKSGVLGGPSDLVGTVFHAAQSNDIVPVIRATQIPCYELMHGRRVGRDPYDLAQSRPIGFYFTTEPEYGRAISRKAYDIILSNGGHWMQRDFDFPGSKPSAIRNAARRARVDEAHQYQLEEDMQSSGSSSSPPTPPIASPSQAAVPTDAGNLRSRSVVSEVDTYGLRSLEDPTSWGRADPSFSRDPFDPWGPSRTERSDTGWKGPRTPPRTQAFGWNDASESWGSADPWAPDFNPEMLKRLVTRNVDRALPVSVSTSPAPKDQIDPASPSNWSTLSDAHMAELEEELVINSSDALESSSAEAIPLPLPPTVPGGHGLISPPTIVSHPVEPSGPSIPSAPHSPLLLNLEATGPESGPHVDHDQPMPEADVAMVDPPFNGPSLRSRRFNEMPERYWQELEGLSSRKDWRKSVREAKARNPAGSDVNPPKTLRDIAWFTMRRERSLYQEICAPWVRQLSKRPYDAYNQSMLANGGGPGSTAPFVTASSSSSSAPSQPDVMILGDDHARDQERVSSSTNLSEADPWETIDYEDHDETNYH